MLKLNQIYINIILFELHNTGHSLLQFLRRCAEHYLGSEQQEVRIESVRTCSRLLRLAIESPQSKTSHTVRYTISTVIKQILVVGVSDTGQ